MKILKLAGKAGSGKTTMLSAIKRDFMDRGFTVLDFGYSRTQRDPVSFLTDKINEANLDIGKAFVVLLDSPTPAVIQWLNSISAEWLPNNCTLIYTSEN